MKLYICPKECGCGAFGIMLLRLKQLGVEPKICDDDPKDTFFDFGLEDWSLTAERNLNLKLFKDFEDSRRPCVICYSRGYDHVIGRQCECCGEHIIVCIHCVGKKDRKPSCSFCKTVAQDAKKGRKRYGV